MLFTFKMNRNQDFQRLYRLGAFCSLGSAFLYAMPNQLPYNRFGITAGKKVGNAVKRNRAKRIIRAAYAACEPDMPIGLDIVIIARASLPEESALSLTDCLRTKGVRHLIGVSSGKVPSGKPNQRPKKTKQSKS